MPYPQVVRVYTTFQEPDYDNPWQSHSPRRSTGSGVIVEGGAILTGAHVVANATFLQLQKLDSPDKVVARVKAVCHDCDLALLEPVDPGFTAGITPAHIGDLPVLRDHVSVVGYPMGGDQISITQGVVSRVEVQRYSHSQRSLLAVTVDAAINKGNSGGPVFKGNDVVGIAFQKLSNADNIGELVPAPMLRHFIEGAKQQRTLSIPALGITFQRMENPALRRHMNFPDDHTGVLVNKVHEGASAWNMLQPGDALLSIDGFDVANNGTVQYRKHTRTHMLVTLGEHYVGDDIPLRVWRDGKVVDMTVTLQPLRQLVPRSRYDRRPSYLVFGGLVFQPLTRDFLATWTKWTERAPKELLYLYQEGVRTPDRQQVIVLSQVLADDLTVSYNAGRNNTVVEVNGEPPRSLIQLTEFLDKAHGSIEFKLSSAMSVVIEADEARASAKRILDRYNVPADRSMDLRATDEATDN